MGAFNLTKGVENSSSQWGDTFVGENSPFSVLLGGHYNAMLDVTTAEFDDNTPSILSLGGGDLSNSVRGTNVGFIHVDSKFAGDQILHNLRG